MLDDKKNVLVDRILSWGKDAPHVKSVRQVYFMAEGIKDPGVESRLVLDSDGQGDPETLLNSIKAMFDEELSMALLVHDEVNQVVAVLYPFSQPRIEVILSGLCMDPTLPASSAREGDNARFVGFVKRCISRILHKFELAANAHYHSDYLGYYALHYPILLDTIQLQAMISGKQFHYGNTKHLLNAVMGEAEHKYFTTYLLDTGFNEANQARQHFMDWFFSLIEDVEDKVGVDALPTTSNTIVSFCERVHDTYYLRNFRPVQGTNKVFRSLAPAVYAGDPRLERWFVLNDIKTLIDLRRKDEYEKAPDDPDLARKLGQSILLLNFNADDVAASDYTKGLIGCTDIVRQIFEAMLDSPGSTLLHCGAGKDRTGIISALVELLIGVPEDKIVVAYLLSGQDTREERIVQTLSYLREHGGIQMYLESCGFCITSQERLLNKLKDQHFSR